MGRFQQFSGSSFNISERLVPSGLIKLTPGSIYYLCTNDDLELLLLFTTDVLSSPYLRPSQLVWWVQIDLDSDPETIDPIWLSLMVSTHCSSHTWVPPDFLPSLCIRARFVTQQILKRDYLVMLITTILLTATMIMMMIWQANSSWQGSQDGHVMSENKFKLLEKFHFH